MNYPIMDLKFDNVTDGRFLSSSDRSPTLAEFAASAASLHKLETVRDLCNKTLHDLETPLISVIIPCYNHAHFLPRAIASVLHQTYRHFEIVVVDDGSADHAEEVVARYPEVIYIKQENQGLAAARNTGIRMSRGSHLVFLDADDRLLPTALEAGLRWLRAYPECAFVSGDHRRVAADGSVIKKPEASRVDKDHYLTLLRRNYIGMHATVMYRREALECIGGFDTSLTACEDYDLYLRIAKRFPIHRHNEVVAEYHLHGANMSCNTGLMLKTALAALRSQWKDIKSDKRCREAYKDGISAWKEHYGKELIHKIKNYIHASGSWKQVARAVIVLWRYAPHWFAGRIARYLGRFCFKMLKAVLPDLIRRRLQAKRRGLPYHPAAGHVRLGDLRRVTPISRVFGFDRGLPIDRYYIEDFLAHNASDIKGRVLEIGDNTYTRKFGGDRVDQSDVLHVSEGNPLATFVGDLTNADHIPSCLFDCVILTQTLHLIYDVRAALATLYRILKPGGVLLATIPGISQIDHGEWGDTWYWSFTALSARRLFEEIFQPSSVEIATYGNVLAAVAFMHGLAVKELRPDELDHHDPGYQLLITVKAVKREVIR